MLSVHDKIMLNKKCSIPSGCDRPAVCLAEGNCGYSGSPLSTPTMEPEVVLRRVKCTNCQGSGSFFRGPPCMRCNKTGWVLEPIEPDDPPPAPIPIADKQRETLQKIIEITSQTLATEERAWTALSQVHTLALEALR